MSAMEPQKSGRNKRIADVDRKRVLVIDDDLPLRGMLAAALRQHGFQVLLAGDGAEGQRDLIERIALKRLGTPNDIAHGVLFFASEYAGWITGQVLSIDGGK